MCAHSQVWTTLFSRCLCHGGCTKEVAGEWVRCVDRSQWTPQAQLLWLFLAWLLPQVPGGSALLVRREINTLQTSCLVGRAHSASLPMPAVAMETKVGLLLSATIPGLGQLWAKATVVRAGQGEERRRRDLGDLLSLFLLIPPLGLLFCLQT